MTSKYESRRDSYAVWPGRRTLSLRALFAKASHYTRLGYFGIYADILLTQLSVLVWKGARAATSNAI